MKQIVWFGLMTLVAGSVLAADATPKEGIVGAAKKLGEKANDAWKTTIVVPEDAPFKPGPTEGKTQKDGLTHLVMSFGERKSPLVVKGAKGAALDQQGVWKSLEELDKVEGPARFFGVIVYSGQTAPWPGTSRAAGHKSLT